MTPIRKALAKPVKAWAIVNPAGKYVGFGKDRDGAWLDVSPDITHYPFKNPKPKGFRCLRVLITPL